MNTNKVNIKLIVVVLLLAIVLPLFATISGVYANISRTELERHANKYGYAVNASDSTVKLDKTANGYVTAENAEKKVDEKTKYNAGSYHVYKISGKAINLSRKQGQAGSWINVDDLAKAETKAQGSISGEKVTVKNAVKVYRNAKNALEAKSAVTSYPAGTYHIYKRSGNAINISKSAGSSGGWIDASELEIKENKQSPKPSNNTKNDDKVTLSKTVDVYMNGQDAKNRKNPVKKYPAGTYYVFNRVSGAVNVSRVKGQAGAWVNLESINESKVESSKPTKPASKPQETKPSSSEPKESDKQSLSKGSKVNLKSTVKVYLNADNARLERNSLKTYAAGTYYIFNTTKDAINISKTKNSPGAWINIKALDEGTKPTPSKPVDSPKVNTNSLTIVNGVVNLPYEVPVYKTSYDALKSVGNVGTFKAGKYYVFNTNGNAVNITKVKGVPGGWISATVAPKASDVEKPRDNSVDVKPENGSKSNFVLVLDPGHGAGAAHNRGGLLFNEGDQNYKFALEIQKAANKYQNVTTQITRKNINEDPSLRDRSKAGNNSDLYLSVHSNASSSSSTRGVEMYGSVDNKSQVFAEDLTKEISKMLSTPNRGVKYRDYNSGRITSSKPSSGKDYYGVLRGNGSKEKYIVETVFHTNYQDSKVYLDKQQDLAETFMKVIARHYNLRLK